MCDSRLKRESEESGEGLLQCRQVTGEVPYIAVPAEGRGSKLRKGLAVIALALVRPHGAAGNGSSVRILKRRRSTDVVMLEAGRQIN